MGGVRGTWEGRGEGSMGGVRGTREGRETWEGNMGGVRGTWEGPHMFAISSPPHQVPRHRGQSQLTHEHSPRGHLVPHIALIAVHVHQPGVTRDLWRRWWVGTSETS